MYFSKKRLSCIVPNLYACVFLFFFLKGKTLTTTLKLNSSFSIMAKRILLQAHLPLLTLFHVQIDSFLLGSNLILSMNSLCFVTFFFGGVFSKNGRGLLHVRAFKGGDKVPKRRGAYLLTSSHILGMNPPMGLKVLSLDS